MNLRIRSAVGILVLLLPLIAFVGRAGAADWQPDSSEAHAINDRGQVAGYSDTAGGETHAFLWSP